MLKQTAVALAIIQMGLGCRVHTPQVEAPPPLKIRLIHIGPREPESPPCGLPGLPSCAGPVATATWSNSFLVFRPGLRGEKQTTLAFDDPRTDTIDELLDAINADGSHWRAYVEPPPENWSAPAVEIKGLR